MQELAESSLAETLGSTGHLSGDVLRPAVVAAADLRPPAILEVQAMDGRMVHERDPRLGDDPRHGSGSLRDAGRRLGAPHGKASGRTIWM